MIYLLTYLKDTLGRLPVPDIGVRLESLMLRMRRLPTQSMATWAAQVRLQYRHLQIALSRVRKAKGEEERPTAQTSSSPSAPSSPTRRASMETETEPHAEDDDDRETEMPEEPRDDEPELKEDGGSWRRRRGRKESDSDDSIRALEDIQMWDAQEEHLPEVLPSEVLGWLMLRRAGLTSQQRLSVQAAAGNSLRLEAIEKALRGMEEELIVPDHQGKGSRDHGRRRNFWVEEAGQWSLVMSDSTELEDALENAETFFVGDRLPAQACQESSALWSSGDGWQEADQWSSSWWSSGEGGDPWGEDAWWNEEPALSDLSPDEQKEVDEAFAVAESKMRNFMQARQAVPARNLSRGFYPFAPHSKGSGPKGKKGKGKSKGKSSPASSFVTEGFLGAAVGDAAYTGCFICGDKGHDFRSCPKRSSSKGRQGKKGGQVNFVDGMVFAVEEILPEGECFGNEPSGGDVVPESELAGYAVIDSGATETVTSLPALEALVQLRQACSGEDLNLEVTQEPVKRFKFGNGEHAFASSYVLLEQVLGDTRVRLGMYTLDVVGVPILLGMKTLKRLKAVIDFSRCMVVFAAVDPGLAIGLRRSRSGHLLLNLTQDWLSQGIRLDRTSSELTMNPPILCADSEENEVNAIFMTAECDVPNPSFMPDRTSAEQGFESCCVARECADEAPDEDSCVLHACHGKQEGKRPQRISSQRGSSMRTLIPFLAFAALHGANLDLCDSGRFGDYTDLGSRRAEVSAQAEVQGKERGSCSTPRGGERGRPRSQGSPVHGPAVLWESSPSKGVQRVSNRIQPVCCVREVQDEADIRTSSRPTWDAPKVGSSCSRCTRSSSRSGSSHVILSQQQGDQLDGRRELCSPTCGTAEENEGEPVRKRRLDPNTVERQVQSHPRPRRLP